MKNEIEPITKIEMEYQPQIERKPKLGRRIAAAGAAVLALAGVSCTTTPNTSGVALPPTCTIAETNLAVGDSITAGGVDGVTGWPKQNPPFEVNELNNTAATNGGWTIDYLRAKALGPMGTCRSLNGDAVLGKTVVMAGVNDAVNDKRSGSQMITQMDRLLSDFANEVPQPGRPAVGESDDVRIVSILPIWDDFNIGWKALNNGFDAQAQINDFNAQAANKYGAKFINCVPAVDLDSDGFLDDWARVDHVHPSQAGSLAIANCINTAINI